MLKSIAQKIIPFLPRAAQFAIYRRLLRLIDMETPGVVYKVAQSPSEVTAALKLLQERYIEEGIVNRSNQRLRATKYHLSPNTSILIGKQGDKVVCTLSLIMDGPVGLPLDEVADLSGLRNRGHYLAEVSGLAVSRNRFGKWKLLFNLIKFMWQFAHYYTPTTTLICGVHNKTYNFYRGLLLFEELKIRKRSKYSFVNDSKPLCLHLNLKTAVSKYKEVYNHKNISRNLYSFFVERKCAEFELPSKAYFFAQHYFASAKHLEELCKENGSLISSLKPKEALRLGVSYFNQQHEKLFNAKFEFQFRRIHPRFSTYLEAYSESGRFLGYVSSVSRGGILLNGGHKISEQKIRIVIGAYEFAEIVPLRVRKSHKNQAFKVVSCSRNWIKYINELEKKLVFHSETEDHSITA